MNSVSRGGAPVSARICASACCRPLAALLARTVCSGGVQRRISICVSFQAHALQFSSVLVPVFCCAAPIFHSSASTVAFLASADDHAASGDPALMWKRPIFLPRDSSSAAAAHAWLLSKEGRSCAVQAPVPCSSPCGSQSCSGTIVALHGSRRARGEMTGSHRKHGDGATLEETIACFCFPLIICEHLRCRNVISLQTERCFLRWIRSGSQTLLASRAHWTQEETFTTPHTPYRSHCAHQSWRA